VRRLLGLAAIVLGSSMPLAATPSATAAGSAWTVQPSSGPSGATYASLNSVSCRSASFCAAAGGEPDYGTPTGAEAFVDMWNGSAWATDLVSGSSMGENLNGVSCASASFCVAVGTVALNDIGAGRASIVQWDGSAWATASPPLPKGNSSLSGVSCASARFCVAVGQHGKEPWTQPLTETWNGSVWRIATPPSIGGRGGQLAAVTCLSARWCMVLGEYYKGHLPPYPEIPRDQWIAERWNGHRWRVQHPTAINDQPSLGPDPWNFVTGVGCSSPRSCVGVGLIPLTQGDESPVPIAVRWNGHTWSTALKGLPRFGDLAGVACPAGRRCLAAGEMFGNGNGGEAPTAPLLERWNGLGWARVATPHTPGQAGNGRAHGALGAIACRRGGVCTAVGQQPHGANTTTLVESGPG
jgi:hypothetical protein